MWSYILLASTLLINFSTPQSFDPNQANLQTFDLALVGTDPSTNNASYHNPISTVNAGDPFVLRHEDWYFLTYTTNDNITLKRSRSLTDNWDFAESKVVFKPNASSGEPWSTDLWAPELHHINQKWYIIFTATPDKDAPPPLQDAKCPFNCPAVNHRMFVLESSGPDAWTSSYALRSTLDTFDQFAIDGTYFHHADQLYHIYSCWKEAYSAWPANLCITRMSDPLTINSTLSDRAIISVPDEPWEQTPRGRPVRLASNEGPQQLVNPHTGQNFVVYSAARVDTPFYCLGLLELVGDDPMLPCSWRKHREGCVFQMNPDAGVYGTGHASFTVSPDGTEHYVVYHAQTTDQPTANLYRTIRTQKFTWDENGAPTFPAALNGPFDVPRGQN
ncbi:alpha-N-arabinofuranosidase 2 [Aspergillus taichungensis]|uniref:Alpha-N-arabinofuranosidase 2 n=1 Tax=Aspergillus taichungensis TaxID=482145 RepID=A0A2J5HK94_9EURO|nr:alpha-N-arabinofuranosidase 2 [Aspergillus taichungensis]